MPEDNAGVGREDVAGHRRFEDQAMAFHHRVRRGYLEMAESTPGWHTLDAGQAIDVLAARIWQLVEPLLPGTDLGSPGRDLEALAYGKE